jgi:hypothetical protein
MSLVRRTPLRAKRPTPRRRGAACSVRGCHRRPRLLGICQTHAVARADRVIAAFVKKRDGGCVVVWGTLKRLGRPIQHGGGLQWSHLISRRYHATRWNPDASVAMCAAHHVWFTHHPLEFEDWRAFWCGPSGLEMLKRMALSSERPDLEQIITTYGGSA